MKKKLFTIALSLIVTLVFAQDTKTFTKDNYTIDYPSTWEISEQKIQPAVQFMVLSDESSQEKDKFRENINLSLESLQGQSLTAAEYAKISLDQIKVQIPNAEIITDESIDVNGSNGHKVIWSADFGNGMILKFKQIILVRGGNGYVLTFSSTTSEYDEYIKSADKMMGSFKFVN